MTTRQFATSGLDLGLVLERRFKDNWCGAKRLVLNQELKLGAWGSWEGSLYTQGKLSMSHSDEGESESLCKGMSHKVY